ncbi:MAG TPA: hypothetical protein VFB79_23255 [Candidatus Angelobacter sp.]|nr:hypothetical protein [Candidatus Angelobacter sp.]
MSEKVLTTHRFAGPLPEAARLANKIEMRLAKTTPPPVELLATLAKNDSKLNYSSTRHLFYCIAFGMQDFYGVFGDGDNAGYEWFVWYGKEGRLETSNVGCGDTNIALLNVLNLLKERGEL